MVSKSSALKGRILGEATENPKYNWETPHSTVPALMDGIHFVRI
jgi:hypothetical protein